MNDSKKPSTDEPKTVTLTVSKATDFGHYRSVLALQVRPVTEICNNYMVRQVDYRWNHILPSLYLLQQKLASLNVKP